MKNHFSINRLTIGFALTTIGILSGCNSTQSGLNIEVYETSASGNKLTNIESYKGDSANIYIQLLPEETYQKIIGFGGAFTEASASLLNQLSNDKRQEIIESYFGQSGARYSLTRTHISSCDFSLKNYTYAPVEDDTSLANFSIKEDMDDLIPMIKDAQAVSKDGFKILASPWTAPPWMKDNKHYVGGKLLPEFYDSWALFFSKYLSAYKSEGIDIWGVTVENEPLGSGDNWESMHFTAKEMVDFTANHLGPQLETDGYGNVVILGYDQNRGDDLKEWADVMFKDDASSKYFDGTAVHWYSSTYDWMPESLEYTHQKSPNKLLIQTEGCVDAEVPHWQDDKWYWTKEATDWGWIWAQGEARKYHPKYVPVYRYARDIIGCMNSWVEGWIDWNMVLDRQGGPNWFGNWCVAPVIVDQDANEVYYTPLYYTLAHFSKFIRPGALRIGFNCTDQELMLTGVQNPDGSIVVVILNMSSESKLINLTLDSESASVMISDKAIQTIIIK